MRVVHRTTSLVFLSICVVAASAAAWQPGPDDEILVSPEDMGTAIKWCQLMANDGPGLGCEDPGVSATLAATPIHGVLNVSMQGDLEYVPENSFWRLGTDTFTYRVDTGQIEPRFVNVTLKAGHYGRTRRIEQGFENGPVQNLSGDAEVDQKAAISGSAGLRVRVGDHETDSVFTFYNDGESDAADLCENNQFLVPADPECFIGGDGAQGGNDTMAIRPPPIGNPSPLGGGLSEFGVSPVAPVVIYSLEGFAPDDVVAEVELVPGENDLWEVVAHLYDFQTPRSTHPFPLTNPEPVIRIDWWDGETPPSGTPRDGGLLLWVDGEVVDSILGVEDWYVGRARRRVGAMIEPGTNVNMSFDFDDVKFRSSRESVPGAATILFDGFETDLSGWDNVYGSSLSVVSAAGLVGLRGLRAEPMMVVNNSLFDASPEAADQVGVRFKIAPGTLSVANGTDLRILALSTVNVIKSGPEQMRLSLRKQGNYFELVAQVRNGYQWLSLPGMPLSNQTSTVELRWRASDPDAKNGRLALWVDGRPAQDFPGLDNEGVLIESIRLGAWRLSAFASGAFYLDNFEAWSAIAASDP